MARSTEFINELKAFFTLQDATLNAALASNPGLQDNFTKLRGLQEEIYENYQRMIMIHIDEPDNEFQERLMRISDLFKSYDSHYYQSVWVKAEGALNEAEQAQIASQLKKEDVDLPQGAFI